MSQINKSEVRDFKVRNGNGQAYIPNYADHIERKVYYNKELKC